MLAQCSMMVHRNGVWYFGVLLPVCAYVMHLSLSWMVAWYSHMNTHTIHPHIISHSLVLRRFLDFLVSQTKKVEYGFFFRFL